MKYYKSFGHSDLILNLIYRFDKSKIKWAIQTDYYSIRKHYINYFEGSVKSNNKSFAHITYNIDNISYTKFIFKGDDFICDSKKEYRKYIKLLMFQ